MQVLVIIAFIFALAIALFAASNSVPVTIRFLSFKAETSLATVALGSAIVGALVTGLIGGIIQVRLGLRLRRERSRLRRLENEVLAAKAETLSFREGSTGKCKYEDEDKSDA